MEATLTNWLKAASPDDREEVARAAGLSVQQLYDIAKSGRPVPPRVRQAIVRLHKATGGDLPLVE